MVVRRWRSPSRRRRARRDRDGHDAGRLVAPVARQVPAGVRSPLHAPGVVDERRVLAALADGEYAADRRRQPVVQRRLDEQPAGVGGAGLGDLAQPTGVARAVLGRDQADIGGQRVGMLKAAPVTDLGAPPERGQGVDPAQTPPPRDRRRPQAFRRRPFELAADVLAAREQDVVRVQVVGMGDPRGRVIALLVAEPVAVLERPALAGPGDLALAATRTSPAGAARASGQRAGPHGSAPDPATALALQWGSRRTASRPAANSRASRIASRLSVLIRSPGRRSMFPGQQTAIPIPSARARRTSP